MLFLERAPWSDVESLFSCPGPNGTFSNATRLQAAAECTPCLPGHFCNDTGLEAPAGTCAPGHFCTEGAIVAAPDHTW